MPEPVRRAATPADVVELIASLVGVPPDRVERMPYGHRHVTYDVHAAGRDLIVRTNVDPSSMVDTERNLAILRGLDLPVPEIVAADLRPDLQFGYLVLAKIPGRDLGFELPTMTRRQMAAVAERVVDAQRRAATLPAGAGFGWVAIGRPGTHPTWRALLARDVARQRGRTESIVPPATFDAIEAALERAARYIDAVQPTCFLDDLTTKNVIVEHGELRGFVDFDCVCYGDPLYWFGLTQTAVFSNLPRSARRYLDELARYHGLGAEDRPIVDLYAAIFALDFLAWRVGREEADGVVAAEATLAEIVARLA